MRTDEKAVQRARPLEVVTMDLSSRGELVMTFSGRIRPLPFEHGRLLQTLQDSLDVSVLDDADD